MHSEPFVEILAFWELYRHAQVAGALKKVNSRETAIARTGTHQCRFGIFPELVLLSTLWYVPTWLEGACLSSAKNYNVSVGMPYKAHKPKNVDMVDVSVNGEIVQSL